MHLRLYLKAKFTPIAWIVLGTYVDIVNRFRAHGLWDLSDSCFRDLSLCFIYFTMNNTKLHKTSFFFKVRIRVTVCYFKFICFRI